MFNKSNFCHVASNNRNEQKTGIFVYKTTDDIDTVLESGYFNEKIVDINLHDLIIHVQINAADKTQVAVNTLCVTGRSLDNVTTKVVSTGGGSSGVSSLNGQTGDLNIKSINGNSLLGSGDITIDGDYVPQLDTMPTATNLGEIVQYSGTTDANYTNGYFYESAASYSDPTATISQTTGSGLTDLAVNVDTFIATEQPTQSESAVFTAIVTTDSATYTTVTGSFTLVGGNLRGVFENHGWPFGDVEHNGVIVFDNSQDCYIGPNVGVNWFYTNVGVLESYGFQFIGTPTNGDVVQYSYTDGSTSWTKGGETVNPADYGVSYSGVPNNGDALTVVYTAPVITGYSWERKDVQPAPDVGIDWKTSVDLPGNFQEGSWVVTPIFKITGGLPDGIYEFYYQIKTGGTFASAADFIPAIVTFRYLIKVDNSSASIKGMFAPVIDGEWIGNNGKRVPQEEESFWSLGWKDGSGNLYFWSDSVWWATDLHGYVNPCPDVSDCFKLSAIKNLTTGQEYIAEGSLYDNVQPGGVQMASQIVIKAIQVTPYVPNSTVYGDIDISVLGASQTLFCQGIRYESGRWINSSELTVNLKCGADRFSARFQAFVDEYVLTIDEATGIFENTGFVKTANSLYVKLNLPAGTTSGIIQSQYAMKDMTMSTGCSFYNEDITGQATTQLIPLKVGVTPSVANYLGKILQYEGATDANYTNGYFYKATGNVVNVPGSVTCTETSGLGKTITLDVDGFLNYMMGLGYDKGTIENWLNNRFIFEYNVDANSLSWNPMGVFPDPTAALQYFTFSPAAASGEYIVWETSNYVAAHADVQNGAWTQVQTQSGAVSPTVMPTLLVANWSSNTQMITVQGVTASNNVIVSPAPASASDWASAGIICTAQSTDSLTFTCQTVPSNDITVNVAIL